MTRHKLLQIFVGVGFIITLCSAQSCYGRQRGHLPGDVTLGFLFSYDGYNASTDQCDPDTPNLDNIQLIEAALMIVQNARTAEITFGMESWDTCSSSRFAVEASITYLTDRLADSGLCSANIAKPGIVAGLGQGGQGEAVANLMNDAQVPVISFAASQSDLTQDDQLHYFLRTLPNDDIQAAGLVKLLQRMRWSYVTVIKQNTTEDEAASRAFQRAARQNAICVPPSLQFSCDNSLEDMDQILTNITQNTSVRVAIVFASSSGVEKLVAAIQRVNASALQFIWSRRATDVLNPALNATSLQGMLGFQLPTYSAEDNFDAYFRNLTPAFVDPARNAWFSDYWQRKYKCNLPGSESYRDNCSSAHVELHKSSYVRHPYVPNVIDAVMAYTTSIQSIYNDLSCSVVNQSNPCDFLSRKQILSYIRNVNFTRENSQCFTFLPSGDIAYSRLDVVSFKRNADGKIRAESVGYFESGELNLNSTRLELVNSSGMVPVQSVCGPSCMDPACGDIIAPPGETVVYLSGDVILAGLFSVHDWNDTKLSCGSLDESGVKRLEAMLYALDKINNDSNILPGLKLGMDGFDTCASPGRAGHQALQLASGSQFGQSGSGQRPNPDGLTEHVFGFVGPNGDEECEVVNGVLRVYSMPMISYAATDVSLSNPIVYKNFARTVFSDSSIGIALLQVLADRGWTYVQALQSNTASGRLVTSTLQNSGPRMGVCLTNSQTLLSSASEAELNEVFEKLKSRSLAKAVVISATNNDTRVILNAFQNRSLFGQFYLILASEWASDPELRAEFLKIAPGIVFISERKRSYPDFKDYFSKLNPDMNQRNPWFAEYWAEKFQCNLHGARTAYAKNCSGNESLTLNDGNDRRIAQTVDAVYAMARAISSLQDRYCNGDQIHVCPEMAAASGDELFQLLGDFNSRFDSINDGHTVAFNIYGDVSAEFDIYNVQSTVNGTLSDVKVGAYQNYNYQGLETIKVYRQENNSYVELEVTNATSECVGNCEDCKKLEKVTVSEIAGGDVWIGGLFELHEPSPDHLQCQDALIPYNVQLLEAFLFAVEQVNADSSILPDLKLGAIGFDTCGSEDRARREVLNFVSGTVEFRSGYPRDRAEVVGIIGGQTSGTTVEVAKDLTPLGVNQISYGATTTELDDSERFPYFHRTVPSDETQATAIVDLLFTMNWQYVSIVYSNTTYGADLWKRVAKKLAGTSICVAMTLKLHTTFGSADYDMVVLQLQLNPYAKTVLLLTSDMDARRVLEAAEKSNVTDLQWIGTDSWGDRDYVVQNAQMTSRGALVFRFQQVPLMQAFKDYFTSRQLYKNRRNPWWQTYWEDTFQCNIYGNTRYNVSCLWQLDLESVYKQETEVSYVLDAVQLFATGLHNAMVNECPDVTRYICDDLGANPTLLHRYIQEANATRHDGSTFRLDKDGNGEPFFDVLLIEVNVINGTIVQNSYRKVGNWTPGGLQLDSVQLVSPTKCKGRCAECRAVEQSTFVYVPAPLQILGLFDIHGSGDHLVECGELRDSGLVNLEAMLFAIQKINADPTILNGITVGATAFDTCERGSRGVRDLSSAFDRSLRSEQNTVHETWSLIGGVIGGEQDQVTLATASLTNQYKYTQISYGAGNNGETFTNLLRVGPTIDNQVLAVVQLLQRYQWQYVGLISSASAYRSQQGRAFASAAVRNGICVGTEEEIVIQTDIPALLQKICNTTDQNVVVLFTDKEDTLQITETLQRQFTDMRHLTWLIAFGGLAQNELSGSSHLGTFSIDNSPKVVPEFDEYFSSLTAFSNNRNPWFTEFLSRAYNCSVDDTKAPCGIFENVTLQVARESFALAANVINAVYTVAHGLQDLRDEYCGSAPGLCAAFVGLSADELQQGIRETTFMSLDGSTVNFENGVSTEQFEIWNYKEVDNTNQFIKVGSWMSGNISLLTNQVSLYDLQGQLATTPVISKCLANEQCSIECPFLEPPTKPVTNPQTNPATILATQPPTTPKSGGTTIPVTNPPTNPPTTPKSGGTIKPVKIISSLESSWFIIFMIIAIIGMLCALVLMVVFIVNRKHLVAQAMSPFLRVMLLLGVVLVYLLVPIYASPPSNLICTLQRVWPGIALAVVHVVILITAISLYWQSMQVHVISGNKPALTTSGLLVFFVFLLAFECVIVVEWLILQPAEVIGKADPESSGGNGSLTAVCAFGDAMPASLCYVYVLIVLTFIIILPMWRKKKNMISYIELITLVLMNVGSIILVIVWILIDLLGDDSTRHIAVALIATIKATFILCLCLPHARNAVLKRGPSGDNSNVQLTGTQISFPEYPSLEDDLSVTGSQVELAETFVTYKA